MSTEKRIYHPYWLWEDYKNGFYDNISGIKKIELQEKSIELLSNAKLCREFMMKVISNWKYSCEHNFTNDSLNKIAYLGQSACCIYAGVPNSITIECWSKLTKEQQKEADSIALEVISIWESKNKNIQLCLKLD